MQFESFIARRYLSSRRKPLFASFILFITLLAVATGVFALIFVLAVMNGFERDFRQKVLGFKAPLTVTSVAGEDLSSEGEKWKQRDSRIVSVLPFIEGEAIIQTEVGGTVGVRVRGISRQPTEGRLGKIYEAEPFGESSLLMGEELAVSLRVHPDFFEKIRLVFPFGDVGPTGDLIPRVRTLTLTGTFRTGFYDYDSKYVMIPYQEADRLFGGEARMGLEIWVEPFGAVESVKKRLEQRVSEAWPDRIHSVRPNGANDKVSEEQMGGYGGRAVSPPIKIETWRDQNPKLFAAMKLEKIGMFLLLSILLLIASFNIFGLTSLLVIDKIKDMAILRSFGLTARKVRKIFLLKAAGIGAGGAAAGGVVGLVVTLLLTHHPIRLPSTYYVQHLPIAVDLKEVLFVLFLVPVLTTLSAFYPAHQAGRPSPAEAIRYE